MGVRPATDRRIAAIALLLIAGGVFAGCSRPPSTADSPSPPSSAALSPAPSPPATPSPSATPPPSVQPAPSATVEPLPSDLPSDLAYAVRQRISFGLRSDLAWVRQVAADPRARMEVLDFLMLPEEESAFYASQSSYQAAAGAIQRYAESHKDEFGGLYIDQPGHTVVSLWTNDPEGHLAEVRKLGSGLGPIVARQVRWSEKALRAVQDKIDWDWLAEVEAAGQGVGADITRNVVEIDISSANPDAPRLIVEHYAGKLGIPPEMLDVVSDGTGVELLPFGWVKGVVVQADGSEPDDNNLMVDGRGGDPGYCGGGDVGYGVGSGGKFKLPCKIGARTIVVLAPTPDDGKWVVVGSADVTVRADETVRIRIRLDQGADIRG